MGLRRLLRPKVIVAVVAAVALLAAGIGLAVALSQPAPLTIRNVRIPVVDGPRDNQHVVIDASFFTPPGSGRLPAVLLAHGFGETKDAVGPQAEDLARAGFAVLTWSARGFGASTGQIGLNSPDYEAPADAARTSQALTESPAWAAASSIRPLRCSVRRKLIRAAAPSSPSGVAGGGTSAAGGLGSSNGCSAGGGVTTKLGSRPRRRRSTEPGARSRVISAAAADSASSRTSRTADSSGAVSRSASARASSPPASAATASS